MVERVVNNAKTLVAALVLQGDRLSVNRRQRINEVWRAETTSAFTGQK